MADVIEGITAATQDARSDELLPPRSHGTGVDEDSLRRREDEDF